MMIICMIILVINVIINMIISMTINMMINLMIDDGRHLLVVLHHLHHHVVQRAEHWARVGQVEGDLGK